MVRALLLRAESEVVAMKKKHAKGQQVCNCGCEPRATKVGLAVNIARLIVALGRLLKELLPFG